MTKVHSKHLQPLWGVVMRHELEEDNSTMVRPALAPPFAPTTAKVDTEKSVSVAVAMDILGTYLHDNPTKAQLTQTLIDVGVIGGADAERFALLVTHANGRDAGHRTTIACAVEQLALSGRGEFAQELNELEQAASVLRSCAEILARDARLRLEANDHTDYRQA